MTVAIIVFLFEHGVVLWQRLLSITFYYFRFDLKQPLIFVLHLPLQLQL